MKKLVNLTQHNMTADQLVGFEVVDNGVANNEVKSLLTFNDIPSVKEMQERADKIALYAVENGASYAMIGGAPYFMGFLESALKANGVNPLYAFSVRDSIEQVQEDGSVRKVNIFVHKGWVEV